MKTTILVLFLLGVLAAIGAAFLVVTAGRPMPGQQVPDKACCECCR